MKTDNKEAEKENFVGLYFRLLFLVDNIEILQSIDKAERSDSNRKGRSSVVLMLFRNTYRITLIDLYSLCTYLEGQKYEPKNKKLVPQFCTYRTKMINILSKYKDQRDKNAHWTEEDFWEKRMPSHTLTEVVEDFNAVFDLFNKTTILLFEEKSKLFSVLSYAMDNEIDKIRNIPRGY